MAINIGLKGGAANQFVGAVLDLRLCASVTAAPGTDGGGNGVGFHTRSFGDAADVNNIPGASVVNNFVILPPGTYEVSASATQNRAGRSRLKLWNTTANELTVAGMVGFSRETFTSGTVRNTLFGRFTITVTSSFGLRHHVDTAHAGNGLGVAVNDGAGEIYAQIDIRKL